MVVTALSRREWVPIAVGLTYAAVVAVALRLTLASLATDDFDGLNNLAQLPLALPWVLIPIGGVLSHEGDAWVLAAFGWLNAALLYLYLRRRLTRSA